MPIKKDEAGKRWVEMELLVPGTPEQVWKAIATGPGYAAWFTRGEIEPRVGGSFRLDFGEGGNTQGEVTRWEPPHVFGCVEREWAEGAPPVATEITISARAGGQCVLRMVHSLFTSADDWDDQVEGFESGWPGFFAVLRVYLAHFADAPAASFMVASPARTDALTTWQRLGAALGLAGANVGERRSGVAGREPVAGIIELVHQEGRQRCMLLRCDDEPGAVLLGVYDKDACRNVSVCRFFYGDDCAERAKQSEPRWRAWLSDTFS